MLRTWDVTVIRCGSSRFVPYVTVDAVVPRDVTKTDSRLAARCAAVASLGAAVIHFTVTPMHWRDWWPSGAFFAVLATIQLVWAFAAWSRQNTLVLAGGIAANACAASLWVMSCITGPPVGPSAGQREEVAAAGICVLLLQLYVVMGAGWAWLRQHQAEDVSGFGRAVVLMGANTIVAGAVMLGVAASFHGDHHHHHGGAAEAQGEHHAHHEAHSDADVQLDGDARMEGDHHSSELHSPRAVEAVPEDGLPMTDMSLDVPGQPPSSEANSDVEADGHQHHHDN